jgi:hypothetical protein
LLSLTHRDSLQLESTLLDINKDLNGIVNSVITAKEANELWILSIELVSSKLNKLGLAASIINVFVRHNIYHQKDNTRPNKPLVGYKDLINLSNKYLHEYIERVKKFSSKEISILYQILYSNIENIEENTNKVILIHESCLKFRNFLLTNLEVYFETLIRPLYYPADSSYVLEPFMPQIFKGYKDFDDGFDAFKVFLKDSYSSLQKNIFYKRILVFYSFLYARKIIRGTDFSSTEGNAIYFDNYDVWCIDPLGIPPNKQFKNIFSEKANEVISEISNHEIELSF